VRLVRRQTARRTNLELHRLLSSDGRAWVKEVWSAAEGAADPSGLSPLAREVGRRLADRYASLERLPGEPVREALLTVAEAGYAARTVVAAPTEQPSAEPAAFGLEPPLDGAAMADDPEAVDALMDPVESIAANRIDLVMSLPPEVWGGFAAVAARRLQRRLTGDGLSWRELTRGRIEAMLKVGYVLACLDETLGLIGPAR
jgi:hypothetical protein